MSEFQHIQLPALAIADMYAQHLVHIPASAGEAVAITSPSTVQATPIKAAPQEDAPIKTPQQEKKLAPANYVTLGNFSKQVLVVLQDEEAVHCTEESLLFLTKIIGAVGLSIDHIALFNSYNKEVDYSELKHQFPAKVALYFGNEPASFGVPIRFPPFQVQHWDGCTFLLAPALPLINGNTPEQKVLKGQLWEALKKIFT